MLELKGNEFESKGDIKLLKGSRGFGVFVRQYILFGTDTEETEYQATKLLSHEQAIEMRDYLIEQYPLDEMKKIVHRDSHGDLHWSTVIK